MNFIYLISNTLTNEYYIGKTNNVAKRFNDHLKSAFNGKSSNSRIARNINKYGKENFTIEVIENCFDDYQEKEKYWIRLYKDLASELCLNLTEGGDDPPSKLGVKHTANTCQKISENNARTKYIKEINSAYVFAGFGSAANFFSVKYHDVKCCCEMNENRPYIKASINRCKKKNLNFVYISKEQYNSTPFED